MRSCQPPPFFLKIWLEVQLPTPPCTRWSGSALSGERTVSYHSSIQELLIINTLYLQAFLNYRYIALGTLSQLQIRPLKSAGPINTILIPDLLHSYAFHAISSFPKLRFIQWNSTLQKYLFDWKLNAPPPKMTLSPTQWPNQKKSFNRYAHSLAHICLYAMECDALPMCHSNVEKSITIKY